MKKKVLMKKKVFYILLIVLLIISVNASQFIGSFTVKETEKKTPMDQFKEFLKNLPIAGNFVIEAVFGINGPPVCYTIPDQETFKNNKLILNLTDFFDDPNRRDVLFYEQNFTYENLRIEFNQTAETADLIPKFNFVGVVEFIVIRATDPFGLFCDSNPFKLTVKESAQPQPQSQQQPSGGGGGDGSADIPRKFPNFILSKNVIELEMYPLDSIIESVNVTNIGDIGLGIKVLNSFPGFVELITKEFPLKVGETKQADFVITAPEIEPDVYTGKIKFTAEGITRVLNIVVNLLEVGADIVLQVTVPDEYKRINPGNKVKADTIINTQDIPKDVNIQYQIRDIEGKVLIIETEDFTLKEFNTKLEKTLQTKEIFIPSIYQFYVKISSEKEYIDFDTFEITLEPIEERPTINIIRRIIIGSSILVLILFIVLLSLFTKSKMYAAIKKKFRAAPKITPFRLSKEQLRLLTISKLEILSKTLDKRNYVQRYLLILNEFLRIYYNITYRFTTQEAIKEIQKKQKNKYLIALLDEIGYLFYMKQEISEDQMKKIISDTLKILSGIRPSE